MLTTVDLDAPPVKSWRLVLPPGEFNCSGGPCFRKGPKNIGLRFHLVGAGISSTTLEGDGIHPVFDLTDLNYCTFEEFSAFGNHLPNSAVMRIASSTLNVTTAAGNVFRHVQIAVPGLGSAGIHLISACCNLIESAAFQGGESPGSVAIRIDYGNSNDNRIVDSGIQFWDKGISNAEMGAEIPANGFVLDRVNFGLNKTADIYTDETLVEPIEVNYAFTEGSRRFLDTQPSGRPRVLAGISVDHLYVNAITDPSGCVINYTGPAPVTVRDAAFSGPTQKICLNSGVFYGEATLMGGQFLGTSPYALGSNNMLTIIGSKFGEVPNTISVIGSVKGGLREVPFSSTPIFDAMLGNTLRITLTGSVVSSTLRNCGSGQMLVFDIVQDDAGGHRFVWPSNVFNPGAVGMKAAKHNIQTFYCDGNYARAVTPMAANQN